MTAAAVLALAVLFVVSAFFSSAETVLTSLSGAQRGRIRARDPAGEELIEKCVSDTPTMLSTLLVGNTFANFAVATLGYRLFAALAPGWGGWAAVPAMTVLLLLFGEITPKCLALRHAEAWAPAYARAILFFNVLFSPASAAFGRLSKALGTALAPERRALSDSELVSCLEAAAEHGEFAAKDAEMIEGVLRLSELHANDEMTPRVDMEGVDVDLPEEEQKEMAAGARHRYLPAYRRTPDAIEGVYDRVEGKMREALFVPEQITLDDLLLLFRKTGDALAVVLDEYGGTAGVITLNDVLEIVVGPSVFADASEEPFITPLAKNRWRIDGRASLEEINLELGIELCAEDADRLSGWVAYHAECIPPVGRMVEADGCAARVVKRRKHRVTVVELEVKKYPAADSDAEMLAETDEAVERTEEDDKKAQEGGAA